MNEKNKTDKGWMMMVIIQLSALVSISACYFTSNTIPNDTKIQRGYAIPGKLEIKTEDMDKNGEKETILKYNGNPYLLTLDETGKPQIKSYHIESAKYQPARIVAEEQEKN